MTTPVNKEEYTNHLKSVIADMVTDQDLIGLMGVIALEVMELRVQIEELVKTEESE